MHLFVFIFLSWLNAFYGTEKAVLPQHTPSNSAYDLFVRLCPLEKGLSYEAFEYAYKGWVQLSKANILKNPNCMAIADFSQSSAIPRLFIIDMVNLQVLRQTYVAHGKASGQEYAKYFSNTPGSFQSSPGFYTTGSVYAGKHGVSMRLIGLQPGINDLAEQRAIVLHGADYANPDFIQKNGRLGRSLGCPAVPESEVSDIITQLHFGACFCIYVPGTPGLLPDTERL